MRRHDVAIAIQAAGDKLCGACPGGSGHASTRLSVHGAGSVLVTGCALHASRQLPSRDAAARSKLRYEGAEQRAKLVHCSECAKSTAPQRRPPLAGGGACPIRVRADKTSRLSTGSSKESQLFAQCVEQHRAAGQVSRVQQLVDRHRSEARRQPRRRRSPACGAGPQFQQLLDTRYLPSCAVLLNALGQTAGSLWMSQSKAATFYRLGL